MLAGGLGTRLYPLTYATNKHLLPVYDRPMIYYPIETLVNAGIKDILVVVSGPYAGHFIPVIQNGKAFGDIHIEYAYQSKPDGGIADALSLAEKFVAGESLAVILGDNTTDADISEDVKNFKEGAVIFLKKVKDPKRFGVVVFDDKMNVIRIDEKPEKPESNMAVTGLYIYDNTVFDRIKGCKPSARGELEITDVNNLYIKEQKMRWSQLKGYWLDAGTFDTLLQANIYWSLRRKE